MTTSHAAATVTAALSAAALTAVLLVAPAPAVAAPTTVPGADLPGVECDDTTCRYEFDTYVFDPQTFVVPEGVTRMAAELAGQPGSYIKGDGGWGGSLRTELDVTAGETLTAQVPRRYGPLEHAVRPDKQEPDPRHLGGDLAALFRGTGASATVLAVVGGGGSGGYTGDGGDGGGWHEDPSRVLRGGDGTGVGAGLGATPTAPGGVQSAGAIIAGKPGSGPADRIGSRGVGGWTYSVRTLEGIRWRYDVSPAGGHGYYGGGSGSHFAVPANAGGGGGGSGYLAPGLEAMKPSEETRLAGASMGRVLLEWSVRGPVVIEPVVTYASGGTVDGVLTSRELVVTATGLPAGAAFGITGSHGGASRTRRIAQDGSVTLEYTLPDTELVGPVRLDLVVAEDLQVIASTQVTFDAPALRTATDLAVPRQVAPGATFTVDLERSGTQLGAATPGAPPQRLAGLLKDGAVRLVLDGEELAPEALDVRDSDLDATGPLTVGLTAPHDLGEHTLALRAAGAERLDDVTRTFAVVTDPVEPTATPTPAPSAGTTPAPGERSDVLAAAGGTTGGTPGAGLLAATGAQVTAVGLTAVLLILGGVLLHRRRLRSRS